MQMTSDLLPTDLTGVNIWDPAQQQFEFRQGPVFSHILLADELNRTPPKTQSALLEAMEERKVSVDGVTYDLDGLFTVLATQNPVEQAGTFDLPESQMDRFLICMDIGYPPADVELQLLLRETSQSVADTAQLVDLAELQAAAQAVRIERDVAAYIVNVVAATRSHERVRLGVSPRGLLGLRDASRAQALLAGRDYVLPDDVQKIAPFVLAHRIVLRGAIGGALRADQHAIVDEVLASVEVPR